MVRDQPNEFHWRMPVKQSLRLLFFMLRAAWTTARVMEDKERLLAGYSRSDMANRRRQLNTGTER